MDLDAFLAMLGAGAPTKAALRADLENQLAAALIGTPPFPVTPAGFSAPVSSLPTVCSGGAADTGLMQLNMLVEDVSDAKTFIEFLASQLSDQCTTAHETAIMNLMTEITSAEAEKTSLLASLYPDYIAFKHGAGNKSLAQFTDTFEAGFSAAKAAGTLPVNNPLQNTKPPTLPNCQPMIDAGNYDGQIDTKAATLKDLEDFNDFLPNEICRQLDEQIAA